MLCVFAHTFPEFVAAFLDRGAALRRRFREETITDMLMSALVPAKPFGIYVDYPDEPTTGADMQWDFVSRGNWHHFRLLIQAKLLYPKGAAWSDHSYVQLFHAVTGTYQAKILADAARAMAGCFPLYAFYNPGTSCRLASASGTHSLCGINLANGYLMERLVVGARARRRIALTKKVGTLHPTFGRLADLFCHESPALCPSPAEIREWLVRWNARAWEEADLHSKDREIPPVPAVNEKLPDDISFVRDLPIEPGIPVEVPTPELRRIIFVSP